MPQEYEIAPVQSGNLDVPKVEQLRKIRSEEQWLRYDTVVIGPGAKEVSDTWFNSFSEFADRSEITWFTSRRTKEVGESFSNLSGTAEDWAQRIYQSGIEFIAPPGIIGCEQQTADAGLLPMIFTQELPNYMRFNVNIQDVDNVLKLPAIHMPGGVGVTGQVQNGAGFLFSIPGQTGDANLRNTWAWPHALGIPRSSKIEMQAQIDQPMREFLSALDNLPGTKECPIIMDGDAIATVAYRNWYRIRIWHRGPRYVQLRGARSAT